MTPKILVIDDSKLVHTLLEEGLASEGFEHLHAYDAQQGLWYAKRANPDLILLDVVMPQISGFELCRQLQDDSATAHIPIVFLTGSSDCYNKVQGLNLGAVDYITKPFDHAELLARVRAALRTKRLVDLLAEQAQVDALTGLRNRKHLLQRLDEAYQARRQFGREVSLLLLDVDHFKRCNDTFGHPFGDRVLQSVAECLQASARGIDVVCRYGGEEFAIILPETEIDDAFEVGERMREAIATTSLSYQGRHVFVTASIGVASAEDQATRENLIQAADEALYSAKQAGRNCVKLAGVLQGAL